MEKQETKNYIKKGVPLAVIVFVMAGVLNMAFFKNSVLAAVYNMLFMPAMAGAVICRVLKVGVNVPRSLVTGYMFMWAVLELVAIPVAWYKKPFDIVVYAVYASTAVLAAAGTVMVILYAGKIQEKLDRKSVV